MVCTYKYNEISLITNSLQFNLNHIADYEISVALDLVVISTLGEHPTLSDNESVNNYIRRKLGKKISLIIGTNQNIVQWDIITLDNSFIKVSGYDLLKSIENTLKPD